MAKRALCRSRDAPAVSSVCVLDGRERPRRGSPGSRHSAVDAPNVARREAARWGNEVQDDHGLVDGFTDHAERRALGHEFIPLDLLRRIELAAFVEQAILTRTPSGPTSAASVIERNATADLVMP